MAKNQIKQLFFPFPKKTSFAREDFFISESNQDALHWIDSWPWKFPILSLSGPNGCGKTHLAHMWAHLSQAKIVTWPAFSINELIHTSGRNIVLDFGDFEDDYLLSPTQEQDLFHMYNIAQEKTIYILLVSKRPIAQWNVKLKDLQSRMRAIPATFVGHPDDQLLSMIYVKLFQDLQWRVSPQVISYLLTHGPRSFGGVRNLVDILANKLPEEKKKLTIDFIKKTLFIV